MNKLTFVERAKKVHGDKYDYSLVECTNYSDKIVIICSIHGKFLQRLSHHLSGHGCSKCSIVSRTSTSENFINKSILVHGDKYDYSLVHYVNAEIEVKIICKKHGEFLQKPHIHLRGGNCPTCSINKLRKIPIGKFVKKHSKLINKCNKFLGTNEFIRRSNLIHNNKYIYSKSIYTGINNKLAITCPTHGDFEQKAITHLRGHGCTKCWESTMGDFDRYTNEYFINESNKIHRNLYSYDKTNYINSKTPVVITCPIHGDFSQVAANHIQGYGCKKCSETISSKQKEIINFLNDLKINYIINDREAIKPYEIDIFIHEHKFGIEFHGLYWHSVKNLKKLHFRKHSLAVVNNIKLIQIFENEWIKKKDIIKSIIANNLKIINNKIYARKCDILNLNNQQYDEFCERNHIQGKRSTNIKLGLFYNNELVMVIGFNRHQKYEFELIRLCSKINSVVIGGASKMFSYFINNYSPKSIMTYCDKRYSNGDIYKQLNFELIKNTKPNYFYTKGVKLFNRQQFQKHKLHKKLKNFNQNLSESQNMFNNGYKRIWDAGHYKFIWHRIL
jgi:hypothetical protein